VAEFATRRPGSLPQADLACPWHLLQRSEDSWILNTSRAPESSPKPENLLSGISDKLSGVDSTGAQRAVYTSRT